MQCHLPSTLLVSRGFGCGLGTSWHDTQQVLDPYWGDRRANLAAAPHDADSYGAGLHRAWGAVGCAGRHNKAKVQTLQQQNTRKPPMYCNQTLSADTHVQSNDAAAPAVPLLQLCHGPTAGSDCIEPMRSDAMHTPTASIRSSGWFGLPASGSSHYIVVALGRGTQEMESKVAIPVSEGRRAATAAQGTVGTPRALEHSLASCSTSCPRPLSWLTRYWDLCSRP